MRGTAIVASVNEFHAISEAGLGEGDARLIAARPAGKNWSEVGAAVGKKPDAVGSKGDSHLRVQRGQPL